jgi:hypothetical protein
MSAAAKKKPVTGDESLLADLHACFGGTIVAVDQTDRRCHHYDCRQGRR